MGLLVKIQLYLAQKVNARSILSGFWRDLKVEKDFEKLYKVKERFLVQDMN